MRILALYEFVKLYRLQAWLTLLWETVLIVIWSRKTQTIWVDPFSRQATLSSVRESSSCLRARKDMLILLLALTLDMERLTALTFPKHELQLRMISQINPFIPYAAFCQSKSKNETRSTVWDTEVRNTNRLCWDPRNDDGVNMAFFQLLKFWRLCCSIDTNVVLSGKTTSGKMGVCSKCSLFFFGGQL